MGLGLGAYNMHVNTSLVDWITYSYFSGNDGRLNRPCTIEAAREDYGVVVIPKKKTWKDVVKNES